VPTSRKDITIPQAGAFRLVVTVVGGPENLTSLAPRMQVRSSKSSEVVLAEATPEMFTIDGVNRQVVLSLPGDYTKTLEWDQPAVYDMYLGEWRLVQGRALLDKTVTREN
jgi:hypothetical protein